VRSEREMIVLLSREAREVAEAGSCAAGGVSAAVVRREKFDVLAKFPAIDFVLDSVVRE